MTSPSKLRDNVIGNKDKGKRKNLTKRYGGITAVDNLHLSIRRGEIYGFLGPNGAGKTTTLRMLLGLIKPTTGTIRVLGEVPGTPAGLDKIGALVESPTFYPYLSGRSNLEVVARYSGRRVTRKRIEEVLKQAGLLDRARDKFGKYSLGMKQRLGIASALLKDPDFLILDEPTNGLDPKGVVEMRELIGNLRHRDRTILFSSHMLGEVEQICDRVGVVRRGQMLAEGTLSELTGQAKILAEVAPLEEAIWIASRLKGVEDVQAIGGWIQVTADPELASQINRKLVSAGLEVRQLRVAEQSLEEVFLRYTEETG